MKTLDVIYTREEPMIAVLNAELERRKGAPFTRPIVSPHCREQARQFLLGAMIAKANFRPIQARGYYLACRLCLRRSRDPFFV